MSNILLNIKSSTSGLSKSLEKSKKAMSSFASTTKISTSNMGKFNNGLKKSNRSLQNITKDANRANDGFKGLNKSMNGFKQLAGSASIIALGSGLAKAVQSATAMVETVNLFSVSMGENAFETQKFVESMNQAFGFDVTNIQNTAGTFSLLARSMGMSSDNSKVLSENATKLSYDLASLNNVPIAQTMADIRSGLVGQSETMYKYGVDVTEAALKQEALNQGVTKSVRNMSQGEKMALRYAVMIRQTGLAQGDFARTINTPANQLKILSERFITLTRTIGTVFLPILEVILPYINLIVQKLIFLFQVLAKLAGYEPPKISETIQTNFSGIEDGAADATDATNKATDALKKMKNASLGMDELNVITEPTSSSSSSSSSGSESNGGIADFDLSGYDNMMGRVQEVTAELENKLKPVLKTILVLVTAIGIAMLSWNIASFITGINGAKKGIMEFGALMSLIKTEGLLVTLKALYPVFMATLALASKISLVFTGIALLFIGLKKILTENKTSWKAVGIALAGVAVIVSGLFLIFGGMVALISAIVGAVVVLGVVIYKNWEAIKTWTVEKWTTIKETISTSCDVMKNSISNTMENIKTKIKTVFDNIKTFFSKKIPEIIDTIIKFFDELPYKIGYALGSIIGTMAMWLSNVLYWCATNIPLIITSIVDWFKGLPNKILEAINTFRTTIITWVNNVITWCATEVPKIITAIVEFFVTLPDKIKEKLNAFKTTISTWVTSAKGWVSEKLPSLLQTILDWFSKLPDACVDIGINIVKGIWNGIQSMGGWLKKQLLGFLGKIGEGIKSLTSGFGEGLKETYTPIKKFANGGYPSSGSMFIANENGAELLGNINGRTAVVNNDQIVEAVSAGVAQAVASVFGSGGYASSQNLSVYLDGEVIYKNQQKVSKNRGVDLGLGVFAR